MTTASDELNEDWVKAGWFDFWKSDGSGQADSIDDMWPSTHVPPTPDEVEAIRHFTELPVWISAPQSLKDEVKGFLSEYGGVAKSPGEIPASVLEKLAKSSDKRVRKVVRAELKRRGHFSLLYWLSEQCISQ